ncbi:DUF1467 family protein [Paracoccus versutus]|uniref:Secreted protein n=1 Tax=Paracoccus versutus TaxID=34007 RepID=A0A099FN80_PARVE|nr:MULTISPECIES: DUF1467 family protein [Paracoccus]WGR61260.1 DUF1467 family protein [Paracoccus ferrooxidans]SFX19716.1 Predicted secreted protein [Paracoccus pantotrophus]KGJ11766.1 hypothetical protein IT40_04915 [Paracoccus versutus]MBT0779645.1 DUF1467 family protein [Paracoccus sp. pheM1]MCJ1899097.1 DUF1467 family protein [Paracoccus versutus]
MSLTGGIVLYAVLWFLVLFVLLPIGQQSQADVGQVTPGTPAGAPHEPKLKKKALWATLIAGLIWGVIAYVIIAGVITRADLEAWTR